MSPTFLGDKGMGQLIARANTPLPQVKPPALSGLSVTLPKPADLSPESIADRLAVMARASASRRDRAPGEACALGDDICIDVLGYALGRLIPFSARRGAWEPLLPSSQLPGFAEGLAGTRVGAGNRVEVVLPASHPLELFRGARAIFLVDLVAARQVEVPDIESPAVLGRMGLGSTLDDALKAVVNALTTERAQQLQMDAINQVLDTLVSRTQIDLPNALVDEQIREMWRTAEAPFLNKKGFSPEEQQQALEGWLSDPFSRADVTRRAAVTAVLRAIAARDGIRATPQALHELVMQTGQALGVEASKLAEVGREELPEEAVDPALHLLTVEHVMKHAKVQFAGAR